MQPATPPKSSSGCALPSSKKSPIAPQMSMQEKQTGPPTARPSLSTAAAAEKSPIASAAPPRSTQKTAVGLAWLSAASASKNRSPDAKHARKAQPVCVSTITTPNGCGGAPAILAHMGQCPQKRKLTTTSATPQAGSAIRAKGLVVGTSERQEPDALLHTFPGRVNVRTADKRKTRNPAVEMPP